VSHLHRLDHVNGLRGLNPSFLGACGVAFYNTLNRFHMLRAGGDAPLHAASRHYTRSERDVCFLYDEERGRKREKRLISTGLVVGLPRRHVLPHPHATDHCRTCGSHVSSSQSTRATEDIVTTAKLRKSTRCSILHSTSLSDAATLGNIHFQDATYHLQIKTCYHNQSAPATPALVITVK
jgi:hypothetical protein